jgi:hypothetical protein
MKRKILAALGLLAVVTTAAYGAGLFQGLPIVGGGSYCVNFATNPTTGAVLTTCNGPAVPAGPTRVTGAELVPADTQLTQGQNPATAFLPVPSLASGAYQYAVQTSSSTLQISNNVTNVVLNPAGAIATVTITMPTAPYDGQIVRISSSQTVTSLTVSAAAGQSITNAPSAITVSATGSYGVAFLYRGTNTTWYRIQ